jgi:hypothetical protein
MGPLDIRRHARRLSCIWHRYCCSFSIAELEIVMKILNKKTRRSLEKTLSKAIKRHAPAIAAGLASGLASSLATLASTEAPDGRGKSNLGKIAEKVQEALGQATDSGKSHKEKKTHRHRHHHRNSTGAMRTEPAPS